MKILLNCDMGEGFKFDKDIFPFIDMANIACSYHAGDNITMKESVLHASKYNVKIGAHISYDDKENFGRKSIEYSKETLEKIIITQIKILDNFCKKLDSKLSYVKPHGAMYNDMMKNYDIFKIILKSISLYNNNLKLMILSTSQNIKYKNIASKYGIELIYEVFADRNYTNEGYLVNRNQKDSMVNDINIVLQRISTLKSSGFLYSIDGKKLHIQSDSICVHGDNEQALKFIKILKEKL